MNTMIWVAGMHRSGTSMVAGVCDLLGATVGPELMPAHADDNAKGFFEDTEIVRLHDAMFKACGLSHESVDGLPEDWRERCADEMAALKTHVEAHYAGQALSVAKDPRMVRFLPLWNEIAEALNVEAKVLIPYRNPVEIIDSLKRRDRIIYENRISVFSDEEYTLLWWLIHVLEAEKGTRGLPRIFFRYADMLSDAKQLITAIGDTLKISWPNPDNPKLEAFISPDMRHTEHEAKELSGYQLGKRAEDMLAILDALAKDPKDLTAQARADKLWKDLMGDAALFDRALKAERKAHDFDTSRQLERQQEKIDYLHNELIKTNDYVLDYVEDFQNKLVDQRLLFEQMHANYQGTVTTMINSTSWKITKPLRDAGRIVKSLIRNAKNLKTFLRPGTYQHILEVWKSEGMRGVKRRAEYFLADKDTSDSSYPEWFAKYAVLNEEERMAALEHMEEMAHRPKISLVMPVYNPEPEFLRQMISSIKAQLYTNWELCIADDASTLPEIRQILEDEAASDDRIKVHFREENGHISKATNDAIQLTSGRVYWFC